jgi:uncharacterized protein YcbX
MYKLARITLYPIKSLDGVDVARAAILPAGPLENDRRFAIFDRDGRIINGKRTAAVHRIRAAYAEHLSTVRLSQLGSGLPDESFDLRADYSPLADWLSRALGAACTIRENAETAFPDDAQSPGPTVVSTGTLVEVAQWFGLSPDEVRRRFRPNLEIDAAEPFWEDRLFGPSRGRPVRFTVGGVALYGVNPCERCVVPTRGSTTGDVLAAFAKRFAQLREQTLPTWTSHAAFDHFYRLTVNTRLAVGDGSALRMQVGDDVVVPS